MEKLSNFLNHVAIPVRFPADIQDFYCKILGFIELYAFSIDRETAFRIFGVDCVLKVTVVERENFKIELYHFEIQAGMAVSHICLNLPVIDDVCRAAENAGYKVVVIDQPEKKLAFITDRSGNLFEIKPWPLEA